MGHDPAVPERPGAHLLAHAHALHVLQSRTFDTDVHASGMHANSACSNTGRHDFYKTSGER